VFGYEKGLLSRLVKNGVLRRDKVFYSNKTRGDGLYHVTVIIIVTERCLVRIANAMRTIYNKTRLNNHNILLCIPFVTSTQSIMCVCCDEII